MAMKPLASNSAMPVPARKAGGAEISSAAQDAAPAGAT
jgi:hypothetical protein